MSTLWTPSGGEPRPSTETAAPTASEPPGAGDEMTEAQVAEEMRRVRAELASTPVVDLVANHAIGLWQLAVLHLTPEEGTSPDLEEASLAIDAMGALVDGLGPRLGDNAEPLQEALSQLRLAFVQVSGSGATPE
ncbi:MAG TPA: hypothetical protein VFW06_04320 [Acidimicrobiia bacterium]|nr:hypothetical protein [Acidimicrobiia bacterium]